MSEQQSRAITPPDLAETLTRAIEETDLRGLDYLPLHLAARYAGDISPSQFRARAAEYGIFPIRFMGRRNVYRKADIQRAIEQQWQLSPAARAIGSSTGRTRPAATAKASAR